MDPVVQAKVLVQLPIALEPTTTSLPAQPEKGESHRTIRHAKLPLSPVVFPTLKGALDDQTLSPPRGKTLSLFQVTGNKLSLLTGGSMLLNTSASAGRYD